MHRSAPRHASHRGTHRIDVDVRRHALQSAMRLTSKPPVAVPIIQRALHRGRRPEALPRLDEDEDRDGGERRAVHQRGDTGFAHVGETAR